MNDSREHILKTAFILFINKGYKAVTLSELEQATKLTKGAFYHYFKSKEDLFFGVIDKYFLSSFHAFECQKISTLKALIAHNVKILEEKMLTLKTITGEKVPDPYYMTLILEAKKYFPSLEEKIKNTFRSQINLWEKVIVAAKESGEIKQDLESSVLAETYTSIGLGIMKNLILDENIDYAITKIKLQYNQLYRLIKV
jgi:TetR/AcrR family transcriptional regulator, transcriptional repressor for nem operon